MITFAVAITLLKVSMVRPSAYGVCAPLGAVFLAPPILSRNPDTTGPMCARVKRFFALTCCPLWGVAVVVT